MREKYKKRGEEKKRTGVWRCIMMYAYHRIDEEGGDDEGSKNRRYSSKLWEKSFASSEIRLLQNRDKLLQKLFCNGSKKFKAIIIFSCGF